MNLSARELIQENGGITTLEWNDDGDTVFGVIIEGKANYITVDQYAYSMMDEIDHNDMYLGLWDELNE